MSITERNGSFMVRVRENGKRRTLGTFYNRETAERAEHDWALGREGSPTVEQWVRVWLHDYRRDAPATQSTYHSATKRIVEEIGHLRLDAIDRPRARKLAQSWPQGTSRIARTLWADAVRDGLAMLNPFTNLRLETPRGRKDLTALSEPQIVELAALAERVSGDYGQQATAIVLTLAYVGCRPGELCALRSDDLDLDRGEVTIRFSMDAHGNEKAPKNGKARVVMVPPPAVDALRVLPVRRDSPYVFHSPTGKRLSKGSLSYLWRPIRAAWVEAGGAPLDLYGLRHACATLLIHRGLPAHVVAQQLGHTDGGRLVMSLYGHPEERISRDLIRMAFAETATRETRSA